MSEIFDRYLQTVAQILISEGSIEEARLLAQCEIISADYENRLLGKPYDDPDAWGYIFEVVLAVPIHIENNFRAVYDPLAENEWDYSPFVDKLSSMFSRIIPHEYPDRSDADALFDLKITIKSEEFNPNWRSDILNGDLTDTHNNNPYNQNSHIWNGMRFSSPPEVEIAKALDRARVLFLPNPLTRVEGLNRIPDFLICYEGKWGILEVDGQTYHTTANATQDHERSRLIERAAGSGIRYFTRYDAKKCMNDADSVVREFLGILASK